MNKYLHYVNLSLELHVVSTFWLGSDTSGTFLHFAKPSYGLERPAWKMLILWWKTDICSCKLSAKVSLMLDNSFPVPSLCKLNHTTVCFIQISTKITCKQLYSLQGKHHHNIIATSQRFLLRRPVFPDYHFVSCDYGWNKLIFCMAIQNNKN